MAKIFIETFTKLGVVMSSTEPLVQFPPISSIELTIPTDANSHQTAIEIGERIISVVARDNCIIYFIGSARGSSTNITSPSVAITANATEYFAVPERDGDWYHLTILVKKESV